MNQKPISYGSIFPRNILRIIDALSPPASVHAHSSTFTPVVQAFRFYNDDGTEATSTPIANQDTNITADLTSGNLIVHLRYRIQETGGATGAGTDDYTLQFDKNSSGSWVSVTGATANVRAATTSQLTADGATTDRATNGISGGTGSFVAGEQEETNGVIEDCQLTASNFTEHVWAITLVRANLNDGDTLDFRISLNGGTPGLTNSVTPRITINDDDNGYDSIGGTLWTPGDKMVGARIKSGTSINANRVSAYCRATGGGSANTRAVIYSDSSGPATLLGLSNELVLSTTLDWQTFTFSSSVSLTAGTIYWLGIFRQDAGVDAYYDDGNANVSFFASPTYPTAPDPLITESLESKRMSIYATEEVTPEQKFWFRTMHVPGMRYPLRGLHIGRSWFRKLSWQ